MASALRFGALGPRAVHLCVDMQTLFAERTDWHVPWLERVLPAVMRLAEARRGQTVFTRFVPPDRPEEASGAWRRYYEHWRNMTRDRINPRLIELVPPLAALAPPDRVIDKAHYSPFKEAAFLRTLGWLKAEALVISGAETDVCVLAAVMDAVDAGYRVILVGTHCAAPRTNPTMPCCDILARASASRSRSPPPRKSSLAGAPVKRAHQGKLDNQSSVYREWEPAYPIYRGWGSASPAH